MYFFHIPGLELNAFFLGKGKVAIFYVFTQFKGLQLSLNAVPPFSAIVLLDVI